MPVRLEIPMLSVDPAKMRNVDTRNVENLFGMWSVFSKCADTVEDGRRLENMSWRIWNRETLCCETQPKLATTPAIDSVRSRPKKQDVPELSSSVDSLASNDSDTSETPVHTPTAPLNIARTSSSRSPKTTIATSRGKERHITSLDLEKMVVSIQDKQEMEPLSPTITDAIPAVKPSTNTTPRPTSPSVTAPFRSSDSSSSTAPMSSAESDHSAAQTVGSDTSAELLTSHHSIVRGFSPTQVSSSLRSSTHLAPAAISTGATLSNKNKDSNKSGMGFMLGGSSGSSGEEGSSLEDRLSSQTNQSSLTAGLKRPQTTKKQLSFKDEVESRTLNNKSHKDEEVFESSDEEDSDDDDAIEEDSEDGDDEEWEDDASESGEIAPPTAPTFQRVDSKPNLVSRRSLLTDLMNQSDRAAAFANMASKSTPALRRSRTSTPNGPSVGASPEEQNSAMLGPHMTLSKPIVTSTANNIPMALSPRSTRREMLATELPGSLRKDVLWERQQKKSTVNAVVKRRHTAHNLTNLKAYPEPNEQDSSKMNEYFSKGLGEYHQAGW
ncbi:hypothetical protein P7C71_g4656, partial [Lecanoromycetidae sp. Uapishka_2]